MLQDQLDPPTLYYVHDPMCSWCWAFRPAWQAVQAEIADEIAIRRLVGGLAPDSDQPMKQEMQQSLQGIWRQIQESVPGTEFNFDFWTKCQPRRSTYPACRAVLSAFDMDPQSEEAMIHGIQQAYYLNAQNPSDIDTLTQVAEQIGLDGKTFEHLLTSEHIEQTLQNHLRAVQAMGVWGFPSLYLQLGERLERINIDYNSPGAIVAQIQAMINA